MRWYHAHLSKERAAKISHLGCSYHYAITGKVRQPSGYHTGCYVPACLPRRKRDPQTLTLRNNQARLKKGNKSQSWSYDLRQTTRYCYCCCCAKPSRWWCCEMLLDATQRCEEPLEERLFDGMQQKRNV
jgi:hypothetical protein